MSTDARAGEASERSSTGLSERLCALGYHRAFAGSALRTAPIEALHPAVGFERIGIVERVGYKFGARHAVAW